jgi:hypothetical protein
MKKVIIQELNSKEVKTHTNGKKFCNCGIKVNNKWYNGSMWEADIARFNRLKPGDEIIVDFYTTEKNGTTYENFKLPSAFQEIKFMLELILNLMAPDSGERLVSEPLPTVDEEDEPEDNPF